MGELREDSKTILITGAGGYLGRYTVRAARRRGHTVRALVRRPDSGEAQWDRDDGIIQVVADLNGPREFLSQALRGVDVVIHIAASLHGDDAAHASDTIAATTALYDVITDRPLPIVLASSMSVYQGKGGGIDESSPLEPDPQARDAYMRAKLAQEDIAHGAVARGISTKFLRLGAIFGPDRCWNAHLGLSFGPVFIRLAGAGELPLCYAPHAASALVSAALTDSSSGIEALNIIDDNLPDAKGYLRALGKPARFSLPLPWQVLRPIAVLARALHLPAPGLLRTETLLYRFVARQYSNARAKAALDWAPTTPFEVAVTECKS